MSPEALARLLDECPLVASVQAGEGSPMDDPAVLLSAARSSLMLGVRLLRLQGIENIELIRSETGAPVIGLIKRSYPGSEVYITPTLSEVEELLQTGCEVIAVDATERSRPHGQTLRDLVSAIQRAGRLVLADCDNVTAVRHALEVGVDLVGTTLSGYTPDSRPTPGPDINLVVRACRESSVPVLAEGRYQEPWQVSAALRAGASGVVIGGALNDPVKQTARFLEAASRYEGPVGAVDIGGTWLRFAKFTADWQVETVDRVPLPATHRERLAWIEEMVDLAAVDRVGISAGGVIDPHTAFVVESKPIVPGAEHQHYVLSNADAVALNDGLAAAWGHACYPEFCGLRVATLALGTGVGCGFVAQHQLWMGPRGEYPRINDLPAPGGGTIEGSLGGANLNLERPENRQLATYAVETALSAVQNLYFPDVIVLSGGVGLSDWLLGLPQVAAFGAHPSPFGDDAGLFGAAALALFPPSVLQQD